MKLFKRIFLAFGLLLLLTTLFGDFIGRALSGHVAGINNRLQSGQLTSLDKVQCHMLYNSIIVAGKLPYPEAADILQHYVYGKGENLYLEPDYLKISPVIAKHLQQMRVGETRTVGLKQQEDWRLSYAINGFTLKKTKDNAELSQHIVFSHNPRIYTDLNLYLFTVRIPDGLVHALEPTPFMVYTEWEL